MALGLGELAQLGLFAGVAYLMFRRGGCCGAPVQPRSRGGATGEDAPRSARAHANQHRMDALAALQTRLAKGEIDVEQYERLRKEIART